MTDPIFADFLKDKAYVLTPDHQIQTAHEAGMDMLQWSEATYGEGSEERRQVALDQTHDATLSTVFLGFDHGHNIHPGAPLVFETMVFGHDTARVLDRYTSYEEALQGHNKILAKLQAPAQ